jgi:AraC-like DNA-binding protein
VVSDVAAIARELEDGIHDECVKLGVKPLAGRWTVVHLPTLTVQFIHKDATLVHRIRTSGTKWVVFVPLATSTGWAWDGEGVSGETLVLAPPGAESVVFDPAGTELAMISLPATAVPQKIAVAARLAMRPHCHLVRARSSDAAALVNALVKLRDNAEFKPDMISRVVRTQTDAFLRYALEQCSRGARAYEPSCRVATLRGDIVRGAEDFIRAHTGEAVSIAQLSHVAGVSERSLRNAFYHVCKTSPKRYLRIWQLHRVRRSLRATANGTATVTNVATEHGFYELGRFAAEYRALFGETPSQTLHNARADLTTRRRITALAPGV